jgi:hypothetical protein
VRGQHAEATQLDTVTLLEIFWRGFPLHVESATEAGLTFARLEHSNFRMLRQVSAC